MQEAYGEFAALYDRLMGDVDYDGWAAYLASFLPAGIKVLECGCGTGEITLRMQRRGFSMMGMDLSPDMLDVAAGKARKAGLAIPFLCQDMRAFSLHRPVGAILCPCDGVNYLLSLREVAAFLRAAKQALEPGGWLLFDISSLHKLSAVLGCNTFAEEAEGCAYIWHNAYDEESRLLEMDLTFFQQDAGGRYRRFTERHLQRAHTVEEMLGALEQAGFQCWAYRAFTLEPPGIQDERIQFVARSL